MSRPLFEIPGLEIFEPASFEDKLRRFGQAGIQSVHGVFDFDLTLTTRDPDTGRVVSSWGILEQHLPPEAQKRCQDLFSYYYPLEQNDTMTVQDAETWWRSALTIQRDSGLNLLEVEMDFVGKANIRPGAEELFDFLSTHDIPSVILSAGVKNVIDLWCAAYNVSPSVVVSTVFDTDDDGTMIGWDESTLVHTFNKAEADHPEIHRIKAEHPHAVVIGDNINDADMATGDENVIRIRVVDDVKEGTDDKDSVRQATAKRFDAMIEDGSLHSAVSLMKHIRDSDASA